MAEVELAKLISPMFWISQLLGLLPIAHKNGHFVVNRAALVYSLFATGLCLLVGLVSFFQMVCKYVKQPIAGENVLQLFINVIVYLFALLNVYYALRCSVVLCSIFQELDVLLKILANQSDVEVALRQIKILTYTVQVKCRYIFIIILDVYKKVQIYFMLFFLNLIST